MPGSDVSATPPKPTVRIASNLEYIFLYATIPLRLKVFLLISIFLKISHFFVFLRFLSKTYIFGRLTITNLLYIVHMGAQNCFLAIC